jgi:outer membrane receptor protein involved in Fe transport
MQFRLAASKTVARPQFRELAPQQFLDLETDRTFIGNPLLSDSELINLEGRLENYIGRGERITLAGFFKDITNPIENVAFVQGGGTLFTGFSNAPSAQLYGAEVELVKYFPLYDLGGNFFEDRRLLLAANYTYTKSEIKVASGDQAINPVTLQATSASNLFDDGDRLTGQSTHVANLPFGLEREDGPLSQQTILLTYNSPRVTARGPQDQPDLIERTGWRLDFVLREEMNIAGQDFEMKFEARNVLGTGYRESQSLGNSVILNNAYDVGTRFSMSIGLKF